MVVAEWRAQLYAESARTGHAGVEGDRDEGCGSNREGDVDLESARIVFDLPTAVGAASAGGEERGRAHRLRFVNSTISARGIRGR